jgi:predicted PurR-regulated permease PerM
MQPSNPTPDAGPAPAATARSYSPVALAILTGVLVILCLVLAYPFLPALTWGVALAVIAWPLQRWLDRRISRRGLSAAVTTIVVVAAVAIPMVFVVYRIGAEAASAAEKMKQESANETMHDKAATVPGVRKVMAWAESAGVDIDREVREAIADKARNAGTFAQGTVGALLQLAIAVFILYYVLLDRERLLAQVRTFLPLSDVEFERVRERAAGSVHANLYANFLTSVIYGVGGALLFAALGLPSPITWAVVMFVLSFLPILGAWLVWAPAAIYLAVSGHGPQAAIIAVSGIAAVVLVDNFLYFRLAGDRMKLHQVPALMGFLGGLALFGAAGMVLGPGIVAVTVAILDVWHTRATRKVSA